MGSPHGLQSTWAHHDGLQNAKIVHMGRNVPKRWAQGDLSAAQDEAADAQTEAIVARVSATVAAALRAELVELRSWSQEVPELVARTEKLEQFVRV
jgi:hypothetical protein